jgi:hypothetical protein
MKIIQTLWLKDSLNSFNDKVGWYSSEYHWMGWSLSCLQLSQFYAEIELVTNLKGKEILIDKLNLPYSKVTLIDFDELTNEFWSLAKVEAYQIQNEPFLHVDGDIFIWKAFDEEIINSDLIAQNAEDWFSGYDYILNKINEIGGALPSFIEEYDNLESYNLGVVGGLKSEFFNEYRQEVFRFVEMNKQFLSDLVKTYNHSYVNMFIEQFMFTQLAASKNLSISTILKDKITDPDYPEITNFYRVPRTKKFVHLMGKSKGVPAICKTLSKILRRHYPSYYYRIIKCCIENNVELDCKVYSNHNFQILLSEVLDNEWVENKYKIGGIENFGKNERIFQLDNKIFNSLQETQLKDFQNYEYLKKQFSHQLKSIEFYYAKDVIIFSKIDDLFILSEDDFDTKILQFDETVFLLESSWNWNLENLEDNNLHPEALFQTLLIPDIYSMTIKEQPLDSLNMILIDSFLEPIKISEAIKTCALYYEESKNVSDDFKFLIRERIRELMNWGALK